MLNLYALCDMQLLDRYSLELEDFVDAARLFGAKILQYRDKEASLDEKQENIKKLRRLWEGTLIVNDEISLAPYCDGVHLGQEDLERVMERFGAKSRAEAIAMTRKLIGAKIVGLSTHSQEEIEEANRLDLDYIGLGAYRATKTKDVRHILGDRLPLLAAASKHRVVAIGGVRLFEHISHIWLKAVGSDLCIKALTYA